MIMQLYNKNCCWLVLGYVGATDVNFCTLFLGKFNFFNFFINTSKIE